VPEHGTQDVRLLAPPRPQGRYVAVVIDRGVAYTAGMTPRVDGRLLAHGLIGRDLTVDQARELAGVAAGNALAAVVAAVGGAERVVRCLQLTVFLAATPDFTEHTAVADGASDALLAVLGPRGAVARAAVGVVGLPSGAPVEVVLTAAVDPADSRTD
jgi:Putative translation initiation inhibitor, yjgF family